MGNSETIIKLIDEKLIISGKPYLSLAEVHKLLIQKDILSLSEKNNDEFKKALENGFIPHAYKTESSPIQWRIPISEDKKTLQQQKAKERKREKNKREIESGMKSSTWQKISIFLIIGIVAITIFQISFGSQSRKDIKNSELDSSVYQVKLFLKTKHLNDPDSYESVDWSKVIEVNSNTYRVRHKFRAKNEYGALVIENKIFSLDSLGNVTDMLDVN